MNIFFLLAASILVAAQLVALGEAKEKPVQACLIYGHISPECGSCCAAHGLIPAKPLLNKKGKSCKCKIDKKGQRHHSPVNHYEPHHANHHHGLYGGHGGHGGHRQGGASASASASASLF